MEKKFILLACAGGFSTSMLVERMKASAKERGIDVDIEATGESNVKNYADKVDVILLGPQMGHALESFQKSYAVPSEVIDQIDYGMMRGDKVLDRALELIENK